MFLLIPALSNCDLHKPMCPIIFTKINGCVQEKKRCWEYLHGETGEKDQCLHRCQGSSTRRVHWDCHSHWWKSWSWHKIVQWLSRNPPGNHSTYISTISHIFSRQKHRQNSLHPSTCPSALFKLDKKITRMWLGLEDREVVQGRYISPRCL